MFWTQLSAGRISGLDSATPVIIPTAAVEQHGPHLPTGTDTLIAEALCTRIEEKMADSVLMAPVVTVGCSSHHVAFGGTLSLSHRTYQDAVDELLRSVTRCGFTNVVLLNSHGGNAASNRIACERVAYCHDEVNLYSTNWWSLAAKDLSEITESGPGGVGHAGEFETSIMLAIAPALVGDYRNVAPDGPMNDPQWCAGDMLRAASVSHVRPFHRLTQRGVFGRPATATAAKGERILEVVVTRISTILEDIRKSGHAATGA